MTAMGATPTIDQSSVALATAHGITPRVITTWNPALARTPRVLVPVQLDALVVRTAGGEWADCKMRRPRLDSKDKRRRELLPPPFSNRPKSRDPGVYLHWALPDALTHGVVDPTTEALLLPPVPNRWLVVRLSPSPDSTRRAVQGWVLKIEQPARDQWESIPQPVPLDQWKEVATLPTDPHPLTALGFGDPAWAAYYDNVENLLGFYDALAGVTSGPLAYLVCGWYADPTVDPLGQGDVHSLDGFHQQMARLRWELSGGELHEAVSHAATFVVAATMAGLPTKEASPVGSYAKTAVAAVPVAGPGAGAAPGPAGAGAGGALPAGGAPKPGTINGAVPGADVGARPAPLDASGRPVGGYYTTDGAWWPQLTLYHGAVVGIGWPDAAWGAGLFSGEVGGPPAASAVQVAVANSVTEGLAALVAAKSQAPDQERLLEAFALGALTDLGCPDGRARIDSLLHDHTFATRDGGFTTELVYHQPLPPSTPPIPSQVTPRPGIFPSPPIGAVGAAVTISRTVAVTAATTMSAAARAEELLGRGSLATALSGTQPSAPPPSTPGQTVPVRRALPRWSQPSDPVLLVQGGLRSPKHGGDGRFSADGSLICRLTGFCVTEISSLAFNGEPSRLFVHGSDLLQRGIENGSVPPECEDLLQETVLLDPGAATNAANASVSQLQAAGGATPATLANLARSQATNYMVEQTAWWALRDPRIDPGPLLAKSGITGTLPSPVAITPPAQPWTPLELQWQADYLQEPHGSAGWDLGEIDFTPQGQVTPPAGAAQLQTIPLVGRVALSGSAATTLAQAVRVVLAQATRSGGVTQLQPGETAAFNSQLAQTLLGGFGDIAGQLQSGIASGQGTPPVDRSALADIAGSLEQMDVLVGALDGFHTLLRAGLPGDGSSAPPRGSPTPGGFIPFRSGFLVLKRLRLVDGFGQFVDLVGSSATTVVDPTKLIVSQPVTVANQPGLVMLPPRFTAPARLRIRYVDAGGTGKDAGPDFSPVCGYLLPNHLDGALEVFGADGHNLGFVRPDDTAGIVWEEAPGVPSAVGETAARAIPNSYLARLAQGLLEWGVADATGGGETALSALLRVVDSTLWAVDPFGHIGDEHLALLIGHPVVVMRARVRLEVNEPVTPDVVKQMSMALRLGALTHWQDGLLGYFINDDYRTLYCADAAAAAFAREVGPNRGFLLPITQVPAFYTAFSADLTGGGTPLTPVSHPYVNTDGFVSIQPNQDFRLTLLVEPYTVVRATAGLLPAEQLGMRRQWVQAGLSQISPTFRFGPVLVDPKQIRMPIASEIKGTWSWDHRATLSTWAEDSVTKATSDALLPVDAAKGSEGWLRLTPPKPST